MPRLGHRGRLQPASHRVVELEARRPLFCVTLTLTVTLILAVVFAVSAWNLKRNQFDKNDLEFHSGDEVAASDVCADFSTLFCDIYEVTPWQKTTVYLLPGTPSVNASDIVRHDLTLHKPPSSVLGTREFYLLEGSGLDVTLCRENGSAPARADVCVIRGKQNYEYFHENSSPDLCVQHVTLSRDTVCSDNATSQRLNMTVTARDTYYLVVKYGRLSRHRQHPRDLGVLVRGSLTRTRFDVTRAERVCQPASQQAACRMQLDFASHTDVVIRFGTDKDDESMTSLISNCHFRMIFWIGLFGGIPLTVSCLAALFFGWLFCKKRRRSIKQAARASRRKSRRAARKLDKDELVHNEVVQGDQGGAMAIQDEDG